MQHRRRCCVAGKVHRQLGTNIEPVRLVIDKLNKSISQQEILAMAPVFLNSLHVPFYGLAAGAVVITWSFFKTIQFFQSMRYR